MAKEKVKSLKWYKEDTARLIEASAEGYVGSFYKGFYFSAAKKGYAESCREVFSAFVRGKFRKNGNLKTRVYIVTVQSCKDYVISRVANMRRQMHLLEDRLGYTRHKVECVAVSGKGMTFGCRWRVTGSPYWRQSTPMFSMFLGEMRRYYKSKQKRKLPATLLERVLLKNSPEEVFGKSRTESWVAFNSAYGRSRFEADIRRDKKMQERFGVRAAAKKKTG